MWRSQRGQRGASFGGWISKPGFDVTTCAPGDFLLDTTTQVYQTIAKGDALLVTNPGVATYTQTVSLPAQFASYSNIVMWANLYISASGVAPFDHTWDGYFDLKFKVVSGVITFSLKSTVVYGTPSNPASLRSAWSAFRGQF